jgi:hypothetical protein
MSNETNAVETTVAPAAEAKKKVVKKAVKKAPAKTAKKKVAKKAAKTSKKEVTPRGESVRYRIFSLLKKHDSGLTGPQIKEKLSLSGIPSLLKDEGCSEKPRLRREKHEDARGVFYVLTAAGRKAVENDTVDSGAPASASGKEWPEGR